MHIIENHSILSTPKISTLFPSPWWPNGTKILSFFLGNQIKSNWKGKEREVMCGGCTKAVERIYWEDLNMKTHTKTTAHLCQCGTTVFPKIYELKPFLLSSGHRRHICNLFCLCGIQTTTNARVEKKKN